MRAILGAIYSIAVKAPALGRMLELANPTPKKHISLFALYLYLRFGVVPFLKCISSTAKIDCENGHPVLKIIKDGACEE